MFNFFGRGKDKFKNPAVVKNPAVLVCAVGDAPVFAEDKDIYRLYPRATEFKADSISELENFIADKTFDIVHLFVNFADDGKVEDQAGIQILHLLTKADTKLVIFACDNPVENYSAAFPAKQCKGIDNMHMVLTFDRQDDNFFNFFQGIFEQMAQGKSMPVAWVSLAPQHDGPWMKKMPQCFFQAKRGQLKFVP